MNNALQQVENIFPGNQLNNLIKDRLKKLCNRFELFINKNEL